MQPFMTLPQAVSYLGALLPTLPQAAIVLGTGLSGKGSITDLLTNRQDFLFADLACFPKLNAVSGQNLGLAGQPGILSYGILEGRAVLIMQGRFHCYQGYSGAQIGFVVQIFAGLGIKNILITNAAGRLNPHYCLSDLMIVTDHIGLFMPDMAVIEAQENTDMIDFADLSCVYKPDLRALAAEWAAVNEAKLHQGVYVGVRGPALQTPAETQMLRLLGADAVGMSLVPEALAAAALGLGVFGCSVISDLGVVGGPAATSEQVIEAAQAALPELNGLLRYMLKRL